MRHFSIAFPPGTELLSANGREHWSKRGKVTASLRQQACEIARLKRIPELEQVRIRVLYYPGDRRRRDPGNLYPSAKAAIDGLVDAKVIKDDNYKIVKSLTMEIPEQGKVTGGQLVIEIEEA